MNFPAGEWLAACPSQSVTIGGALLLVLVARVRRVAAKSADLTLLLTAVSAAAAALSMDAPRGFVVDGLLVADPFGAFFSFLLALAAMVVVWMWTRSREHGPVASATDWALFLGSLGAMQVIVCASHFGVVWAGLTVVGLASARWLSLSGRDAAMRSWAMDTAAQSSAAAAWMLLGLALLLGFSATLEYAPAAAKLSVALAAPGGKAVLLVGLALVLFGMSQSLGMVPSASSRVGAVGKARLSVGAWLLVGLPLTAVAVLLRLARALCEISSDGVWTAWPGVEWPTVLSVLAMITMTVANVAALREVNLKRLVAWWSVAHLGYLGMALSVLRDRTVDAVLFDAVIYAAMVPGALLMLAPLVEQRGGAAVEVLRGIARETGGSRRVAIVVALFLLSLSGVPPLAGYEARAGLMKAVFESDRWVLMAVATINSGLGLLCCTRLLLLMVDAPREQQHPLSLDGDTGLLAGLLVAVIVGAGLWPATLHLFVQRSAMFFTG